MSELEEYVSDEKLEKFNKNFKRHISTYMESKNYEPDVEEIEKIERRLHKEIVRIGKSRNDIDVEDFFDEVFEDFEGQFNTSTASNITQIVGIINAEDEELKELVSKFYR
jgi:DNA anti-recombination protein RmuC